MTDTENSQSPAKDKISSPSASNAEAVGDASDVFPEFETETETADAPAAPGKGGPQGAQGRNIDAMLNVGLNVQVVLGRSKMPISNLLKLSRGSVIELDKRIGEPVELIINDRLVARGDLVKLAGERIGVSLTEIVKDYINES